MILLESLLLSLCFLTASLGLGLPLAARYFPDALERLCAAAALGLIKSFVFLWLLYTTGTSLRWFALAPLAGLVALGGSRPVLAAMWGDQSARAALLSWTALLLWIMALILPIASFSGGAWTVDWFEHHERALFFQQHWDLQYQFIGGYALSSRPPLVNVLVAGHQALLQSGFFCDQVIIGLWSSLVYFPAALFCRRMGGAAFLPILAGMLMLCPSFVQNAAFPWTKLPTAFFVLTGAYFLLMTLDRPDRLGAFGLAVAALAAGLLAHYSAAPYCIVLVGWWLCWRFRQRQLAALRREILVGLGLVGPLLGLWFGWSLWHFGVHGTLLTNSSITAAGEWQWARQAARIAGNLWATLVPHPLRQVDYQLIEQPDRVVWVRDYFFMIAQVNLLALPGTGATIALAAALWRRRGQWPRATTALAPACIAPAVAACAFLGIASPGAPDAWGLAHICLLPLAVLTIAAVTANIEHLGRPAAVILGFGLLFDAFFNIGLHFWIQSRPPPPEWLNAADLRTSFAHYGHAAYNAGLKHVGGLRFVADDLPLAARPALSLMLLVSAGWLLRQTDRLRVSSSPA